ncbi:MAG: response regulator [Clostridia bacterium]|nr:response regulator [Clostridia bacterium]
MRFFVIDDEKFALDRMVRELKTAAPEAEVVAFSDPNALLAEARKDPCDVAFLDVRMGSMTGVELAKRLKELTPKLNIIFVTGYDEYANEAMKMHASGYLMKPVTAEDIKAELQDLRYPILEKKKYLLYFRCFGTFEVFNQNGDLVCFERKKSKELLAYLLYRQGKKCTNQELHEILFEDGMYETDVEQRMYQTLVSSLSSTLKMLGVEGVLQRNYGTIKLDVSKVACDWYEYLLNKEEGSPNYQGEFMKQYSWAEAENGKLSKELYYGND